MNDAPKRILLVDDVRLFLQLECMFLQRRGFEIMTAMTGKEALAMVRERRPHVVLLDYVLPDMRGDECCRQIKGDPELKNTIVIMVTSVAKEQDRTECIQAGCDDYLTKPIKQMEFLEHIRKALDLKIRLMDRLAISAPVRYRRENGSELRGVTLNLSPSGMFIVTQNPVEVGTKLSLSFTLPECPRMFSPTGEVLWNTVSMTRGAISPGFGLRFVDIDPEDSTALSRYVLDHLT